MSPEAVERDHGPQQKTGGHWWSRGRRQGVTGGLPWTLIDGRIGLSSRGGGSGWDSGPRTASTRKLRLGVGTWTRDSCDARHWAGDFRTPQT
ncbi:hypothetical protein NDU88_009498 [Pleurodeles waltl]|uniref:Uncharacterized protein n=1 Tax=Pleurodeles waltl TaxID=8319 RepID=A0AAV7RWA5_PLEWA|nr:hypothetical protein NDU88_009498 [Pleurodeles waltl]